MLPLLALAVAHAEINYGESLAWIAVDADAVAYGRVIRADATNIAIGEVTFLWGSAAAATDLTIALPERGCLAVDLKPGEAVLVFLRADGAPRCATEGAQQWVISLDDPKRAYAEDGRALKTATE